MIIMLNVLFGTTVFVSVASFILALFMTRNFTSTHGKSQLFWSIGLWLFFIDALLEILFAIGAGDIMKKYADNLKDLENVLKEYKEVIPASNILGIGTESVSLRNPSRYPAFSRSSSLRPELVKDLNDMCEKSRKTVSSTVAEAISFYFAGLHKYPH